LNLELANRRRTAAQSAAKNFRDGFVAQSAQQEAAVAVRAAEVEQDHSNMDVIQRLQVPPGWIDRQEDIRRTWTSTLDNMGQLPAAITQAGTRGEKAREVLDYLEGR